MSKKKSAFLSLGKKSCDEIRDVLNSPQTETLQRYRGSLIIDEDETRTAPSKTVNKALNRITEDVRSDPTIPAATVKNSSFYEASVREEQTTQTITIALAACINSKEAPNDDASEPLSFYIQKIFGCENETIQELQEKAISQKTLEDRLVISVKSATGLIPRDGKDTQWSPYVRVGVINAACQEDGIVKSKNLADWLKQKRIFPTGELKETGVKADTVDSEWNEQMELVIGHNDQETLVIEVWSSDVSETTPTRGKSFKDLSVKELSQMGSFIGRAFLPLWSLPDEVKGEVIDLYSHSRRHKRGSITVDLTKQNISMEVGRPEHLHLTRAVINHESQVDGQCQKNWSAELSEEANKLLDKHAKFCGLSELHKEAILLSILVKYHHSYAIKMSTFTERIEKIVSLQANQEASQTCSSPDIETHPPPICESIRHPVEDSLLEDMNELVEEIEGVLQKHHYMFEVRDLKQVEEIKQKVNTLLALYAFSPFVAQLPSEKRDLHVLLENSIEIAVINWFKYLNEEFAPYRITRDVRAGDNKLFAFRDLISHVSNYCKGLREQLNPVFVKGGVDYFTQFFLAVDKLLFVETISKLEIQASEDNVTTYEVYRITKEIRKVLNSVDEKEHSKLKIIQYHEWFKIKVDDWVTLATDRCKNNIKKAIQLDKIVQVTDNVQYSSSAVDSTGVLFQLMRFEEELAWPSKPKALDIRVSIVKSVCDCALFYVGEIFHSLKKEDMFDEQGRFRATEKLSIVLNNMEHTKEVVVKHLKEHSVHKEEDSHEVLEEGEGYSEADQLGLKAQEQKSAELIERLIQNAGEEITGKICDIISQITEKMSPEVSRLLNDIISPCTRRRSTSSVEETDAMDMLDPLMTYMAENLQTLSTHLLTPVLQLMLQGMWNVSNDCLASFLREGQAKRLSNPSQYYSKLNFVGQNLKEFFHANDYGLSQSDLETDIHKNLCRHLEVLSLETNKLILLFFYDLACFQKDKISSGTAELGEVMLDVAYHQDKSMIEMKFAKANNLPGLNRSGVSNPFIEVAPMPYWEFGHNQPKKQRTTTKKKTVNPVFDAETIMIPALKEQLQTKGTVLLLNIYHDGIASNDLCGTCVVPCTDIPVSQPSAAAAASTPTPASGTTLTPTPGSTPASTPGTALTPTPGSTQYKNFKLPLFRITQSKVILKELVARANSSDLKAKDCLKTNKQFLKFLAKVDLKDQFGRKSSFGRK